MSQRLISLSPDLERLRDEGYDIEVKSSGHLLVKHVPYVNSQREIKHGVLVTSLSLAGDRTTTPSDHVVMFAGERPCRSDGTELVQIVNSSNHQLLADDLMVDHVFSSKPAAGYPDYHAKMTTYVNILMSQACVIDPDVAATTFPVIDASEEESVFKYIDTASSRAGITAAAAKLALGRVAIVGLGGSGSYVLDLVAKTPVREIHLYDGDKFASHNAFRSPGAPSVEDLRQGWSKVAFFQELYSKMHRNVIAHDRHVDACNVDELRDMDFVFLSLDGGAMKRLMVTKLEGFRIPFIDVGMGVYEVDGTLSGVLRVTTSTAQQRGHVLAKGRIPFSDGDVNNEYSRNIQIADLNALNAALAVIKWKKLFGFYLDLEKEHHSTYTIDGNMLTNEDQP